MADETVVTVAEVPASRIVVTGENRADFMEKKLGIQTVKPEPEKAAEVVEVEPEAKAEPKVEPEPEVKTEPKKEKTHPIKERMGELANARKEAEARETKERERADKAEREAAELRTKLNPPKPAEADPEPQRAQFNSDEEYSRALLDHRVDQRIAERDRANQEAVAKADQAKVIETWKTRVNEIKQEMPDYEEKITAATVLVSEQVRDAIIESDVGPRILYHLAEHPEDAERIGKLNVRGAIKEIGKLEAKYAKAEKAEPKAEPKAEAKAPGTVEISKAPAPISPLKGASAAIETAVDSNGVFHGTYAMWKAQRKAGKIK